MDHVTNKAMAMKVMDLLSKMRERVNVCKKELNREKVKVSAGHPAKIQRNRRRPLQVARTPKRSILFFLFLFFIL